MLTREIKYTRKTVKLAFREIFVARYIPILQYLVWWIISDLYPNRIKMCERMAALVCDTSKLKATDYRLKSKSFSNKVCTKCYLGIKESIHHVVMQCPFFGHDRISMYTDLEKLNNDVSNQILGNPQQLFYVLMGKQPDLTDFESMLDFWLILGRHISQMYGRATNGRK